MPQFYSFLKVVREWLGRAVPQAAYRQFRAASGFADDVQHDAGEALLLLAEHVRMKELEGSLRNYTEFEGFSFIGQGRRHYACYHYHLPSTGNKNDCCWRNTCG